MERRTEDQITLERRSQLGGKALVWWKREATFHTLQAPHEAGYAVDEHETSASFQVSKSRDVFPQACTACVFSTVYRVFILHLFLYMVKESDPVSLFYMFLSSFPNSIY